MAVYNNILTAVVTCNAQQIIMTQYYGEKKRLMRK